MTEDATSPAAAGALLANRRYPIARSGGLFLVLIGAGILGGIAFSGDALVDYRVFFGGVAVATLSLFFTKRLSFGPRTRLQIAALIFALALEGALSNSRAVTNCRDSNSHISKSRGSQPVMCGAEI